MRELCVEMWGGGRDRTDGVLDARAKRARK